MSRYFIGLGSNKGDRAAYLQAAVNHMRAVAMDVVACSSIYETEPWGKTDQAAFLNAVVLIETDASAMDVMAQLLVIEQDLGRVRTEKWGPRTLDLDILYAEEISCESAYLTLPHPYLWERAFVLVPLAEIVPHFRYQGEYIAERIQALGTKGIRRTSFVLE